MSLMKLRQKMLRIADKLESVRSAAERLNCSRDFVISLIGRGELRATDDKPILVNRADVDARIRKLFKQAGVVIFE